jgi:flagellar biosynthesis anti-sigma factor FlgM
MQIDSTNVGLGQMSQAAQTAATGDTKEARGHHRHAGGEDKVQISDLASQLTAQASASDPQKIEQLKASYESGTYNISPQQIAASMMNEASPS